MKVLLRKLKPKAKPPQKGGFVMLEVIFGT
jgi:hypothetical protein